MNTIPEPQDLVVYSSNISNSSNIASNHQFPIIHYNKAILDGLILHNRLDHPHVTMLKQTLHEIDESCSLKYETNMCGAYKMGKPHRLQFNNAYEISNQAFDFIHVDIWDPSPITIDNGVRCFILFFL